MAGAVLGKGVETALKRGRLGDGKWERRRGSWDRKNEGKRRWGDVLLQLVCRRAWQAGGVT